MAKFYAVLSLLAATVLLFGINLQSARADSADCIVAHSGPAPPGQHWELRGKCWYLIAGPPLFHHAAARPRARAATRVRHAAARRRAKAATRATSTAAAHTKSRQHNAHLRRAAATVAAEPRPPATAAVPDARPPATAAVPDAPPPAAAADGVQPQPHIEILRTVPVGVPMQEAAQPGAPAAQVAPATRGGTANAVSDRTSPGKADAVASVSRSGVKNAAAAVHAADAERSGSDAARQKPAEAPGLASATLPTEMFLLLAIGLSMAVFLIAFAFRIAARRREAIITVSPDSAWSSEQLDPPQVDDSQFAGEATEGQWTDAGQDVPFIDPQALASSTAAPSEPDPKGLEPLLRLLRQT